MTTALPTSASEPVKVPTSDAALENEQSHNASASASSPLTVPLAGGTTRISLSPAGGKGGAPIAPNAGHDRNKPSGPDDGENGRINAATNTAATTTIESSEMACIVAASTTENGDDGGDVLKASDGDAHVDPRFVLASCQQALSRSELEPVELFVAKAVLEQHDEADPFVLCTNYKVMLDAFRTKKDLTMIRKLLIALRTSGSTLSRLADSESNKHARLIHQIVRLVPFSPDTVELATTAATATATATPIRPPLQSTTAAAANHQFNDPPVIPLSSRPCDMLLADAHFRFLIALVSANSVYLVPTLAALWKLLTHQVSDTHPTRCQAIHAAMATIVRLCPQAKSELLNILSTAAPFRMRPDAELVWYYRQSLHVVAYVPSLRNAVLHLIVSRCLELDVEIKITDVGEAMIDDEHDNDTDAIFHLDLDDKEQSMTLPATEGKSATTTATSVDQMADKLDAMMLILFEYTEQALEAQQLSAAQLFAMLTHIFESAIIVTYKSKFVQFLLLHVCGLEATATTATMDAMHSEESAVDSSAAAAPDLVPPPARNEGAMLYREFASNLIDVIIDPYRATAIRQSGACYLASFVSRASFVCIETVIETIDALLRWAEAYTQSLATQSVHAPDAREQCSLHSLFYTVCQSAYYIMCFRGMEVVQFVRGPLRDDPNHSLSYVDLSEAKWTRICSHPLLPLRYCLESVRSEFLRISKFLPLLEDNVWQRLVADDELRINVALKRKKKTASRITTAATLEKERVSGGVGGLGRGTNPLDSFFPFDPYLLRQSHRFVEPFYKHWDGGAIDNEQDDQVLAHDNEQSTVNVVDSCDDDSLRQSATEDDSDESDSDDERELETARTRKRFMSFGSAKSSLSSRPGSLEDKSSAIVDVSTKRGELKKAWSHAMKRARAPSIENGSW